MNNHILTPQESLLIGIIGGTIETIIQMPLITSKICLQNNIKFPNSISKWYRGVFIQTVNIAPITAFQMMTNNVLTKILFGPKKISYNEKIYTASIAGGISSLIYTPVDLITIQQQKKK